MGVRDPKKAVAVLSVHNNVLRASIPLSITNDNNSNLPCSGIRKIVTAPVTVWIKVK
jgi:hypothetical protein